ncbi:hypothetical protein HN51_063142, partial [Arachis hypogaea]
MGVPCGCGCLAEQEAPRRVCHRHLPVTHLSVHLPHRNVTVSHAPVDLNPLTVTSRSPAHCTREPVVFAVVASSRGGVLVSVIWFWSHPIVVVCIIWSPAVASSPS